MKSTQNVFDFYLKAGGEQAENLTIVTLQVKQQQHRKLTSDSLISVHFITKSV